MATRYEKPFTQKPLVQNLLGPKLDAISGDFSFSDIIKSLVPTFLTSYLGNYNSEVARRKDDAIQEVRDNFSDAQNAVQENIDANEVFRKELNLFTTDRRTWEKQTADKIWEASPLYEYYQTQKKEDSTFILSEMEARNKYLLNNMPREFKRVEGYKDNEFIAQPKSFFTKRDRETMYAAIAKINNDPQYKGALFNIASKIGDAFKRDGMSNIDATTEANNIVQEGVATDEVPQEIISINNENEIRGYNTSPYSSSDFDTITTSNPSFLNNLSRINLENNYFKPNIDAMQEGYSEVYEVIGKHLNEDGKIKDEFEHLKIQYTNRNGTSDKNLNPFALFETDPDIKLQIKKGGNIIEHADPRGYVARIISLINNGSQTQLNNAGIPVNNENSVVNFFQALQKTGRGYFDGETFVIDLPNTSDLHLTKDEILKMSQNRDTAGSEIFNVLLGKVITENQSQGAHDLVTVIQKIREAEINMYQENALKYMRDDKTYDKGQDALAKVEEIKTRGPEEESEAVIRLFLNSYGAKDIENINVIYDIVDGKKEINTLGDLSRDKTYIDKLLTNHEEKFGVNSNLRNEVNTHFQSIEIDKQNIENMTVQLNPSFVTDHYWQTGTNYLANIGSAEMAADVNEVLSTLSTAELKGLSEMTDKEIFERVGLTDFSYDKYEGLKNSVNSIAKYGSALTTSGLAYRATGKALSKTLAPALGRFAVGGPKLFAAGLVYTGVTSAYDGATYLIRQRNPFSHYINDYFEESLPSERRQIPMTIFTGQKDYVIRKVPFRGEAAPVPQEFFDNLAITLGTKIRKNADPIDQQLQEQLTFR